ncbi:MAG: Sir2 family NAD-dependent protein deacetylase [Vicinamibacteria bacterium]
MRESLHLDERTWLLVLTGAGVSAESGLGTFRGGGGLWEGYSVQEVASPDGFREDPGLVWRFYSHRRENALRARPNRGHEALARIEQRLGDRFLLVTQNVDELHRRAGSRRLIEVHGRLFQTRCFLCARPPFDDQRTYLDDPPRCEVCAAAGRNGLLRPDIVWFGEALDPEHFRRVEGFIQDAHLHGEHLVFLAAGTSGVVYPAAGLVDVARAAGADTWLVNAEPAENHGSFHRYVEGRSGEVLPRLLSF